MQEDILIEKYRPYKLDDVAGQPKIVEKLKGYVIDRNIPHLMFAGPAGVGKTTSALCLAREMYGEGWKADFKELNASVSKTTPILIRTDGNRIERVDFQYLDKYYNENIENLEVLTVGNDLKVKWSKVTKLIRHKVEKILRVSFEGGRIELTGNHSVIVFNEEGELVNKSAGCLEVGDYLISFCTNLEDSNVIEETKSLINLDIDTSWLYGMYRSEGCLAKNHIVLTLGAHEHEYIDRIRRISEIKLGVNTSETLCGSGYSKLVGFSNKLSSNQVKLFGENIVPFFRNMFYEKHCIEHDAFTKRVPFFMFGHKLENRLSYLKAEYEGDGCNIYRNDGFIYDDNFRVTSVSRNSLVDIAWLGRTSKMHTSVYPENNVVASLIDSFKSELIPADLVINILSKLPKSILDYNWRYDLRHVLYNRGDGYEMNKRITKDVVFGIMNHIIQQKFEDTLFAYLNEVKTWESKENYLISRLRTIINSDIHVVEIKKMEVIEYNDFVYDVSVPENQMFFAGDIPLLLHNSDDRGIDVIRGVVKDFASVDSISDVGFKIILLDEADSLTKDAQAALRRTMEKYTRSCRFILSCNYSSSIIEPIQSRCALFRFKKISNTEITNRVKWVCEKENIKIDDSAVEAIVYVSEGDLRKALNVLNCTGYKSGNIVKICDIYDIAGALEPEILRDAIKKALSREFFAALLVIENALLDGLSGVDILKGMMKEVMNMNIEDKMKVDIVDKIGEAEFRISEGCNELIQLKALIANIVKIGSLV